MGATSVYDCTTRKSADVACNGIVYNFAVICFKCASNHALSVVSLVVNKTCFYHMRITKAQISPRRLISAFVVRCLDSIISLVSISEISSL